MMGNRYEVSTRNDAVNVQVLEIVRCASTWCVKREMG